MASVLPPLWERANFKCDKGKSVSSSAGLGGLAGELLQVETQIVPG